MEETEESKLLDTLAEVRTESKQKQKDKEFTEKVAVVVVCYAVLWYLIK